MSAQKKGRGFTLIELMVAISIIAILAMVGMTAYATTQQSARDSSRRTELGNIAESIEGSKLGDGNYRYTAADFTNDFARTSGEVPNTDPSGNPYCIRGSTTRGVTGNAGAAWTTACPTTPAGYVTLAESLSATTPVSGDLATGSVQSWILCTSLERPAVSPNNPSAGAVNVYCISSDQ